MGRSIRQHYVPQSYLKRFSFDGTRLHTFLIKKEIPSIITQENRNDFLKDISIADVCVAKNYYTIETQNPNTPKDLHRDYIEKDFFSEFVEPKLNEIIDNLISLTNNFEKENHSIASENFSFSQIYYIAFSAFVQYCRSPRQRQFVDDINSFIRARNKIYREEHNTDKDNIPYGLDVAFTHADKTFMNVHLWRMFFDKISSYHMLLRVSPNGNFLTSDNPVVIHKLGVKGKEVFNVNFYKDDFSLFFPLTPNLILEYYSPAHFPIAKQMNNTISIVDTQYEEQVNKYQYINAQKFVFSKKNDFSLFLKPINNNTFNG